MSFPPSIDQAFCIRLVVTLGHFLWQATAIVLLAWLAGARLSKATSRLRYGVLVSALLAMAACPVVTYVFVGGSTATSPPVNPATEGPVPPVPAAAKTDDPQPSPPIAGGAVSGTTAETSGATLEAASAPGVRVAASKDDSETRPAAGGRRDAWTWFAPHLTVLYFVGVLGMLARLLLALHGGRRLGLASEPASDAGLLAAAAGRAGALGLRVTPAIAYCGRIAVPTVVGILRPMILLPASLATGLTPEQTEAILTHELAHIRRYDHLVNLLQRTIESVFFFHPGVWYVSRRIRAERENCCDDLAVAAGSERYSYASSLVRLGELSLRRRSAPGLARPAMLAAADRPSQLRRRVVRLFEGTAHERVRLLRDWPMALVLPAVIFVATSLFVSANVKPADSAKKAAPPAAKPAGTLEQRIARLIVQLGSEEHKQREAAQKGLVQIGKPAIRALQEAGNDKDRERAVRAQAALRLIMVRITLTKETWRNRWEGMSLSFSLSTPAKPSDSMSLDIDPRGKAVARMWDSRKKALGHYESVLARKDLDATAKRLGWQRPWEWHGMPKFKSPAGGTITITITVDGRIARIEQPWPLPKDLPRNRQTAQIMAAVMSTRAQMLHLIEVVRRDATIRAQSGDVGGVEGKDAPSTKSGGQRTAVRKVLDLLDLPWQTKLTAKQLDQMTASIQADADPAVAAVMKAYNATHNKAFRHRAVQILERLGTGKARAALLDIALGRTANKLSSSHGWAARAYLKTIRDKADARQLLASDNTQVLNSALLALKGLPVDQALLKRIGQIVRRKASMTSGWHAFRFAAANVISSDPRAVLLGERVDLLLAMLADVAKMPEKDKEIRRHSYMTYGEAAYSRLLRNLVEMPAAVAQLLKKATAERRDMERDILIISRASRGDATVKKEIRAMLVVAEAPMRRAWAARALGLIGTAEDLGLLKRLADTDPFQRDSGSSVGPPGTRGKIFPVRRAAKDAVRAIEGKAAMQPAKQDGKVTTQSVAEWGRANSGLQARLRADKRPWATGQRPTFRADIRNTGRGTYSIARAQQRCRLVLDGTPYRWVGDIDVKSSVFPPGREYKDIPVALTANWRTTGGSKPLEVTPGKHTLQVIFFCDGGSSHKNLVVETNVVAFEVAPPGRKLTFAALGLHEKHRPIRIVTNWHILENIYSMSPAGFWTKKDGRIVFKGFARDVKTDRVVLVFSADLLSTSRLAAQKSVTIPRKAIVSIEEVPPSTPPAGKAPTGTKETAKREWPSVTGRVLDKPGGKPVGGVEVTLQLSYEGVPRTTRTDAGGRYAFANVKPSVYSYVIRPARRKKVPGVWVQVQGARVTVSDRDVQAHDVYKTLPSVSGTVRDAKTGKGVPGARILFTIKKSRRSIVTDDKGRYHLYVIPREVFLECKGTLDRYYPDTDRSGKTVKVLASGHVGNVDFAVRSAEEFTGQVLTPDGKGAKNIDVHVLLHWSGRPGGPAGAMDSGGIGRDARLKTDAEGKFVGYLRRFRRRDEWAETITLKAISWLPDRSMGGVARAATRTGLGLADPIQIALGKSANATVRVVDSNGKPVKDATIRASDKHPSYRPYLGGPVKYLGNGRYRMSGLIPGLDYAMNASARAYRGRFGNYKTFVLAPSHEYDAGTLVLQPWRKKDIPDLLRWLKSEKPHNVRVAEAGLCALGRVAADTAPQVIEVLKTNKYKHVRVAAVHILGAIGGGDVLPALSGARKDEEPEVRKAAAEAIDTIKKAPIPPAKAFKASFESLAVKITSTWQWNPTITIKGDGTYVFDLQQFKQVPGEDHLQPDPKHYVARHRLQAQNLRRLEELLGATQWLATAGKVQPRLEDGTKYALAVVRGGQQAATVCYGDQAQAYTNLIQFLRRINRQEWLLYQMTPDAQYRSNAASAIAGELDAVLGKTGKSKPYAPVLDYHRFVPPFTAWLAAPDGRKNGELIAAARLMGYLKIESQRKPLEALAANRKISSSVRQEAIRALSRLGGPESLRALQALVDDPDHWVRDSLAKAFVELEGPKAIGVLTKLARKNRSAAWALIRLGPAATGAIVGILERKRDRTDRSAAYVIREYFEHWKEIPQPVDRKVIAAIYERVAFDRGDDYALKVLKLAGRPFKVLPSRQALQAFLATLAAGDAKAIAKAMSFHFRNNDPGEFFRRAKAGKLKLTAMHAERNTAWAALVDRDDKRRCYLVWMNLMSGRVWEVKAAMPRTPAKLEAMLKRILKEHPDAREVPLPPPAAKPADGQVKTDWSAAQEGVEMRLSAARKTWRADEIPALRWAVRNIGARQFLHVAAGQRLAQLEVDGVWHQWPVSLRAARLADLGVGQSLENQLVTVSPIWSLAKPEDLQWKMGGGVFLDPAKVRPSLQLAPGKHTVRLAVIAEPSRANTGKGFRVVSRPLEITVAALPAGRAAAWPAKGKLPQAVKDALHGTVIVLQESLRPRQPKMKEWIARALTQARKAAALAEKTPLHASAKRLADALAALDKAVRKEDPAEAGDEFSKVGKAHRHLVSVFAGEVPLPPPTTKGTKGTVQAIDRKAPNTGTNTR